MKHEQLALFQPQSMPAGFRYAPDLIDAAEEARLALILNWPAHLVAACQTINLGAVFGQSCQKVCEILQLVGNHVDDARFFLYAAGDRHITRA